MKIWSDTLTCTNLSRQKMKLIYLIRVQMTNQISARDNVPTGKSTKVKELIVPIENQKNKALLGKKL